MAFDFVNGTGDQETASRLDELAVQVHRLLKNLITSCVHGLSFKIKFLFELMQEIHEKLQAEANRTQLEELEDAVGLGGDDAEVEPDEETIIKLFRLHQEKEKIREEAENLENPMLRKAERASKMAHRYGWGISHFFR